MLSLVWLETKADFALMKGRKLTVDLRDGHGRAESR